MDPLPPYWPPRCSNPAASAIDPLLLGKPGLLTGLLSSGSMGVCSPAGHLDIRGVLSTFWGEVATT